MTKCVANVLQIFKAILDFTIWVVDSKLSTIRYFFVYMRVVTSKSTKKHMIEELRELSDRFLRQKEYFKTNSVVLSYFEFLKKIVDFFEQEAYYM